MYVSFYSFKITIIQSIVIISTKLCLFIYTSDFPPTSFESTDQYCDIRDFLWLLGHPFRGAYSTTTDHAGGDKRCLLYRMAVVMNDLHSLIASNMHQTGAHTSLDQAPIARICLTFAYYFFDLFEPVDGWPLPPFLAENDFKPTVDDMYYLLSRLSQSSVITRDVEDSMNRILEFSDLQRYSGNSSSGTDDYNPYRYRRIVIDSVFDICDALKTKVIPSPFLPPTFFSLSLSYILTLTLIYVLITTLYEVRSVISDRLDQSTFVEVPRCEIHRECCSQISGSSPGCIVSDAG